MPRTIKKRIAKPKIDSETEVQDLFARVKDSADRYGKQIGIALAALAAMILVVLGLMFYRASAERKAHEAFFEGQKHLLGLYDAKPLVRIDRLNRALEGFQKASDARPSAASLYMLGVTYVELSRSEDARVALGDVLTRFPGDYMFAPLAKYRLAQMDIDAGRVDDALATLTEIYTVGGGPYRDLALLESARILLSQGRADEAKGKFQALMTDFPESPFAKQAAMILNTASAEKVFK